MESLKALTLLGKDMGLEGEALQRFVSEQQSIEREERKAQCEVRQKELEHEMAQMQKNKSEQEHEFQMAKLKLEAEKLIQDKELKVREQGNLAEMEKAKLRLYELEHAQRLELLDKQSEMKGALKLEMPSVQSKPKLPKIPPFSKSQDEMDLYLNRFEHYAMAVGWERDVWATV